MLYSYHLIKISNCVKLIINNIILFFFPNYKLELCSKTLLSQQVLQGGRGLPGLPRAHAYDRGIDVCARVCVSYLMNFIHAEKRTYLLFTKEQNEIEPRWPPTVVENGFAVKRCRVMYPTRRIINVYVCNHHT